jgi:predicted DNA-binding protein
MLVNLMARIPHELKLRLKLYAVKQGKSASAVITEAIRAYLDARELPTQKNS